MNFEVIGGWLCLHPIQALAVHLILVLVFDILHSTVYLSPNSVSAQIDYPAEMRT